MIALFIKFLMGHALSDFGLQSDWIAINKNRHFNKCPVNWQYVLSAHALIHGMAVWLISGSIIFGGIEAACHWCIDFGKCESWYGIHVDQAAHIACKLAWCWFLRR